MKIRKRLVAFLTGKNDLGEEGLKDEVARLGEIAPSTEAEFMEIGAGLGSFYHQAAGISEKASALTGRLSGGEMSRLGEGFAKISLAVMNLAAGVESEKEIIDKILNQFISVQNPLDGFGKIVRNLNALCSYIKIEVARLGLADESFHKLSQDVQMLSETITRKASSLSEQITQMIPSLKENATRIAGAGAQRQESCRAVTEKIMRDLMILSESNQAAAATVEKISGGWHNITGHIGEVVQSLQAHDIARQRIEHVCHALCDETHTAGKAPENNPEPSSLFSALRRRTDVVFKSRSRLHRVHLFRLQAAQLQNADADLRDAAEKLISSLYGIGADAQAISGDIRDVAVSSADGRSFLDQLEDDLKDLAAEAQLTACSQRETAAAMSALSDTALGMSGFVLEMEGIGIEMQRLALNAQVHAAHISAADAALAVMAESIQHLASDTSSIVTQVNRRLGEVRNGATTLTRIAGQETEKGAESMSDIHENFPAMLGALKKVDADIRAGLPQIEQAGVGLAEEIARLVEGIGFHEKISAQLNETSGYLITRAREIAVRTGRNKTQSDPDAGLEHLASKYTMQRERQTHRHIITTAESQTHGAYVSDPDPVPADASGGLGDNVELF
jgi:methyl-accepting chemotaxis protein